MVRSMYSGVSGLRSHQTRMDTIGNNIANVNTYGFKSMRTTFRDIYYQSISAASAPTAAAGGMNPSAVGYGDKVGSVDIMMGRSTFTMTDQTMDMAIDGEGFFQVQDGAGNIYYTRAGMLNFDAAGNLVDMQGNYVLGINGDPTGRAAGNERIQVVLPPVVPQPSTVVQPINGREWTISATNNTSDGDLNFNLSIDNSLADDTVQATISSSGIIIKMHPDNTYANLNDLNSAINNAITQAYGGAHPAGDFNISYTGEPALNPFIAANMPATGYYTAQQLCSTDYKIQLGRLNFTTSDSVFGGVYPTGNVGNTFGAAFATGSNPSIDNISAQYNDVDQAWEFTMRIGAFDYKGVVESSKNSTGKFMMYRVGGDADDYIEMNRPSFGAISDAWAAEQGVPVNGSEFDAVTITLPSTNASAVPFVDVTTLADLPAGSTTFEAEYNGTDWTITITDSTSAAHTVTIDGTHLGATVAFDAPSTAEASIPSYSMLNAAFAAQMALVPPTSGSSFATVLGANLGDGVNAPAATASAASKALGFSGTSFALRGGTEGGPQTLADMSGIYIAPNGIITGLDSQGEEVIIGRIDLVTFANPAGLTSAGSSNFMESANSGVPQVTQPGTSGAGKLVGGSLELSNVDLSREFSDMITTQRGYQANGRIITVTDTMLEELINLKR